MTPLIALLAGAVAVVAMLITLDPLLPSPRPRLRSLAVTGLVAGMLAGFGLLGLDRIALARDDAEGLKLLAGAITMAVLAGATATDLLRDRIVNTYLVAAGTAIVLGLFALAGDWPKHAVGLILTGGAGLAIFAGGLLFARLRHAPDDELTGTRIQDLGSADVFVYALLGAFLGPVWGVTAFVLGVFATGLMAIPIFVVDRLRRRELMSNHMPILPGIATGAYVTLLLFIAAGT